MVRETVYLQHVLLANQQVVLIHGRCVRNGTCASNAKCSCHLTHKLSIQLSFREQTNINREVNEMASSLANIHLNFIFIAVFIFLIRKIICAEKVNDIVFQFPEYDYKETPKNVSCDCE